MKNMALQTHVFESVQELSAAAAGRASGILREAVAKRGRARIVVATGNSQIAFIEALTSLPGMPWSDTEIFHMDEYVGMSAEHTASFRRWIRERVEERIRPKVTHYLAGDAEDLDAECARYAALLEEAPVDMAFVGIGENGHIAFNDPHVARFDDPLTVKRVTLDEACRHQQSGEGHFPTIDDVPREALTMTCPALLRAEHLICSVPDTRKAVAVQAALQGPITEKCPASILRRHPDAHLYLDRNSASLL